MNTACSADFSPGGVESVSRVFGVEIHITDVHGAGGPVLPALKIRVFIFNVSLWKKTRQIENYTFRSNELKNILP